MPLLAIQHDVFVSYSADDALFVYPLVAELRSRRLHVWWDQSMILAGDDLSPRIRNAIDRASYAVCIFSERCRDGYVRREFDYIAEAFGRQNRPRPIPVECDPRDDSFWRVDWPSLLDFHTISCSWAAGDPETAKLAASRVATGIAATMGRAFGASRARSEVLEVVAQRIHGYWLIAMPTADAAADSRRRAATDSVRRQKLLIRFNVKRGGTIVRQAAAADGGRIRRNDGERLVLESTFAHVGGRAVSLHLRETPHE